LFDQEKKKTLDMAFAAFVVALTAAACALLSRHEASACSDFVLNSSTSVVSGRSMDFEVDLKSVLEVIPRGTAFQEPPVLGCPQCPDLEWRARLGFVAFNMYGMNAAADGMNEKGLSAAWLYLVGTKYPTPETTVQFNASLPVVTSIPSYILGHFATVDEVRQGLSRVQIAGYDDRFSAQVLKVHTTGSAPLHVSVHDAHGKSLVIEFIDGQPVFHDNINQVLTNDPPLGGQLDALRERGFGLDAQLTDLPGGYGSTERFQRLSVLNHYAGQGYENAGPDASYTVATTEQRAISDTLHLLNSVVRPPPGEATEWSLVRDHSRRRLYIQSTQNQLLRRVDLTMLDFASHSARRFVPVTYGNWFFDMTLPLMDDANKAKTFDLPPRSKIEALLEQEKSGGGQPIGDVLGARALEAFRSQQNSRRVAASVNEAAQDDIVPAESQPEGPTTEPLSYEPSYVTVFMAGGLCGALVTALGVAIVSKLSRRRGYTAI
jgi:choloylglycine hydrolase